MITLGGDGALLINKDVVYKATFPPVKIKNTVGSGDSTVAGICFSGFLFLFLCRWRFLFYDTPTWV